ncbi:MAG: GIY-YIG nuclease family protein [Candidatus Omnitrophica bacterium]|nr:GIY-YIG nuclease family protein [Candidatus Omnitrophota bacterium]
MWNVYIIKSTNNNYRYIGSTNDLNRRIAEHNKGLCPATKSYKPFKIIACIAVKDKDTAVKLERYLKTGSGIAFVNKRLL